MGTSGAGSMMVIRKRYKMPGWRLVWWREDGVVVVLLGRKRSSASSPAEMYISPGSPCVLSPISPLTQGTLPLFPHLYCDRICSPQNGIDKLQRAVKLQRLL
jgi:hypothetical protein